jgi:hypothetical protein
MAEFNIENINQVFRDAFGYEPPAAFTIPAAAARIERSDLGQPMYGVDDLGREHFLPVYLDSFLLPFAVISINPKKTIVRTPMPERGGSVHEVVSLDDYAINIKGIVINDSNVWPEKEIKKLHDIFKKNESLELRSALTDIFLRGGNKEANGVEDQLHRVVITDMSFPATSGIEHAKPFEINCTSDMIFKLEVE